MTTFDFLALGVILLSVLVSLTRGVVVEIASLFTWVISFLLAKLCSQNFARIALKSIEPEVLRYLIAFILLFVFFWVIQYFCRSLLTQFINAIGLGGINKFLGAAFGTLRGIIIVTIAVLICSFTELPRTEEWKQSKTAVYFEVLALEAVPYLPSKLAEYVEYPL